MIMIIMKENKIINTNKIEYIQSYHILARPISSVECSNTQCLAIRSINCSLSNGKSFERVLISGIYLIGLIRIPRV